MPGDSARQNLKAAIAARRPDVVELARHLVSIPSENPPGSTAALVAAIEAFLADEPRLETRRVEAKDSIVNLIVKLRGARPGRRLIFNGHLDTFPAGKAADWQCGPYSGTIIDNCLYGRGSADMKAGLAAGLMTAKLLADRRDDLAGEFVLALVGDEETGGTWGTQYLLAHDADGRADAVVSADAGSPSVIRFGEKGQLWLEVAALGRSNHGAHVHLGDNAIERLIAALTRLVELRRMPCPIPQPILAAIRAARLQSEVVSGVGESETLQSITVNIGTISGGSSVNIIPNHALACVDIRFPPGLAVANLVEAAHRLLADMPKVSLRVLSSTEPNWTEPDSEIINIVAANAADVLGTEPARNLRPGFSDARFYRLAGMPAVVYGPTPYGMGGVNEHVTLADLQGIFEVHALSAYDYLSDSRKPDGPAPCHKRP
jgi:succinyl-diaminopimelate desuccinylase